MPSKRSRLHRVKLINDGTTTLGRCTIHNASPSNVALRTDPESLQKQFDDFILAIHYHSVGCTLYRFGNASIAFIRLSSRVAINPFVM